jgi:predicted small lipoprotein YifL
MTQFVRPMCAAVLLFCFLTTGCGNKGPLYLPDESTSSGERTEGR